MLPPASADPDDPDEPDDPDDPEDPDEPPQAASSADSEPAAATPPAPRASAARRVMRGLSCPSVTLIGQLLLPYTQRLRQFYQLRQGSSIVQVYKHARL